MRMMPRARLAVAMMVGASLTLAACGSNDAASTTGTIKIAAPLPLSGPAAAYGKSFLDSLQITVDKINASGGIKSMGDRKLEILSADDGGVPDRAPELLRSMIDKGAIAAVGPLPSASVLVSEPVLDELKVPLVSPSFDASLTEQGSQYYFRMIQPSEVMAQQGVDFLTSQIAAGAVSVKKVGVVTMNVPPGTGARDGLLASLKDAGIETVDIQYDPTETRDFGPIIAKLRDAGVDLVMGHQGPSDAALFAAALKLQSWRPANGFLWIAGGPAVNGGITAIGPVIKNWMVVNYAGTTSKNPVTNATAKEYKAKTGEPLDAMSASSPSIIGAIAAALEAAGKKNDGKVDGTALRDALRDLSYEAPNNYLTFAGGVKFDSVGNNVAWKAVITQHDGNGNQATIYPPDVATADPIWPAHD